MIETQGKIFIIVLIILAIGQAKEDLEVMKEMIVGLNERLAKTELELAATKDDLFTTKAKTEELEKGMTIQRETSFLHTCGSNSGYLSTNQVTIPYINLLYSSTNTEGGGLDIITGVFTAPAAGSYTVSWNAVARLDNEESVGLYLQKNGENIPDSLHFSEFLAPAGDVYDQGK